MSGPATPGRDRKREEIEFHDRLRDAHLREDPEAYARLTSNKKFYAVARASAEFFQRWLRDRSPGKAVLDFGCGDGMYALAAARSGGRAVGVDISPVSVANARERAKEEGLEGRATFLAGDCEALAFADDSFDIIVVAGVLHHMDLARAYGELARVLKADGEIICAEALGHNPIINWYRKATPDLRTPWEVDHIIKREGLELAKDYFDRVEKRFFHLASLAAVPFRRFRGFPALLGSLEAVDRALLSLPVIQWQAWQVVFVLSRPKKAMHRRPPATPSSGQSPALAQDRGNS